MKLTLLFLTLLLATGAGAQVPAQLDASFGSNGRAIVPIGHRSSPAYLAVLSDDRLLAVYRETQSSGGSILLIRQLANGQPDNSFGNGGKIHPNNDSNAIPLTALLLPDGKILVGGEYDQPGVSNGADCFVMRLLASGQPDPSFGTNGRVVFEGYPQSLDFVRSIAVQPDGKILCAGQCVGTTPTFKYSFAVWRLTADGRPDSTFGINGLADVTASEQIEGTSGHVMVRSDGKILVGGILFSNGQSGGLVLLKPNGQPDPGFYNGTSLRLMPHQYSDGLGFINHIQTDRQGQLLVLWGEHQQSHTNLATVLISRMLPDGTTDASFANGGTLEWSSNNNRTYSTNLVEAADGTLFLGAFNQGVSATHFAPAIFSASGQPNVQQTQQFLSLSLPETMGYLAFQSNGALVAAADANSYQDGSFLRFHTSASLGAAASFVSKESGRLFPTPAGDALYLRAGTGEGSLRLYDATGRLVLRTTAAENGPVAGFPALPPGPYQAVFGNAAGSWTQPVLKR